MKDYLNLITQIIKHNILKLILKLTFGFVHW